MHYKLLECIKKYCHTYTPRIFFCVMGLFFCYKYKKKVCHLCVCVCVCVCVCFFQGKGRGLSI